MRILRVPPALVLNPPQSSLPSRLSPFPFFDPFSWNRTPMSVLSTRRRTNLPACSVTSSSSSVISSEDITEESQDVDEKFDWFNHWYPLAPVCDLDKRAPHARRVMGLDVVVWWDRTEGGWKVFEDRCPHRLAPLSEGRIDRDGRLQCVYHGWCFDGSGSCKYIPQAPQDGPPIHTSNRACVSVYPSTEQNGIVWFWPSTDSLYKDIEEKQKPPFIAELDDPSFSSSIASRELPYGYEVLTENLMDPAHVPYAHYGLMRTMRRVPANFVQHDREGGTPLNLTVQKLDVTGFLAKQDAGVTKFVAPCVFYLSASLDSLTKGASEGEVEKNKQKKRLVLLFICVPVAPGRSRVIWSFPRNFSVWVDKVIPRWVSHFGQNLILDSDLYLLHLEERKIEEIGQSNWQKACFVPTKSDALVVAFRKWLRRYSGGQIPWGEIFKVGLPPTVPREQLMDRYRSHVMNCSSCRPALTALKILEVCLQVLPIAMIGIAAAFNHTTISTLARTALVFAGVVSFTASKWLGSFIYKSFYFHDYNHAFIHMSTPFGSQS